MNKEIYHLSQKSLKTPGSKGDNGEDNGEQAASNCFKKQVRKNKMGLLKTSKRRLLLKAVSSFSHCDEVSRVSTENLGRGVIYRKEALANDKSPEVLLWKTPIKLSPKLNSSG